MSSIASILPADPSPSAEDIRRSTNATAETGGDTTLGQDDFFSLITTQMVNQNPLEPMEDTDFIAQMATFSSLEQMSELNESFASYRQESVGIASAAYLDKEVTVGTPEGELTGIVSQVRTNAEGTYVVLDGKSYAVDDVRSVRTPTQP